MHCEILQYNKRKNRNKIETRNKTKFSTNRKLIFDQIPNLALNKIQTESES